MSACKDLREFIEKLEERGELVRIKREVDAGSFELSAYVRHSEDGPNKAVLFEKVKGYGMPVIGNLFGNIKRCAIGLGVEAGPEDIRRFRKDPRGGPGGLGGASVDAFSMTDEERALWILLQKKFHEMEEKASRGELSTEIVQDGPCKEVIITKDIDLLKILPVPWGCEGDGGPFINPGGMITRAPDTGLLNIGGYRHMINSEVYEKDRIGVMLVEAHDGAHIVDQYRRRGDEFAEIALIVGMNPAVNLMAWYRSPHQFAAKSWSEFDTASGLMGEPLKMVKCETVDLEVPAHAEVVIEGRISLQEKILEGPMAEYTDYTICNEPMPYIDVTAITHRRDAIYHHLLSGRSLDHIVGSWFVGLGWADTFLARVRKYFPTVKDAAMFPGSYNIHLVVSLEQRYDGEDKQLLLYLMGTTVYKYITILDEDIDPHNAELVEWARNMRAGTNPDDFMVFERSHAYGLDPCKDAEGKVARLGILATIPFGQKHVRPGPSAEWLEKTKKAFEEEVGDL
jgi:UbiD family decarboxylase